MASGGGGSWKVAYADFVTAMMAFFLVMWLGAQDQKTRQSVANYFIDPSGVNKVPAKTGATFDSVSYGSVPVEQKVAMGKGRSSHTQSGEPSPSTKRVSDFLHADKKRLAEWRDKAAAQRQVAGKSREVLENTMTSGEMAVQELAKTLRTDLTKDVPKAKSSLEQDLLYDSFNDVNWKQLAEDLLYE
ncbi:flagellar motor protein MotB [Zavarzinella formosa]|uniref:flagellar motor protein MotB n=1 Tax=Zavarzinella formosa TaxID=360055 RepID=UPI000303EC74|nr:flagellar motor protein MotB [Zavarzinella formosa]